MSVDLRHLLDLDEGDLRLIPLGRNRLLRAAGLLFGAAVAAALPKNALAAPYPCFGYNECSCCSGDVCCVDQCSAVTGSCPSGLQCWQTCAQGDVWQCCDWNDPNAGRCICTRIVANC